MNISIDGITVMLNNLKNEKQMLSDKNEILQALVIKFEEEADSWKKKSTELKLHVFLLSLRIRNRTVSH